MNKNGLSISLAAMTMLLASVGALAQTVPPPVPAEEVFTPEQIGHALAAPTPEAGQDGAKRRQCAAG